MAHAFAQKDHERFIECAHALKSSAASIGAHMLYDLCARACQLVPSDWSADVLSLLHEIENATRSTRANLNSYLEQYKHNLNNS
jgi:HPt (histidine-containing phosphotransfer) domain-containing protein